jgi:hypothetical protein
LVVDVTVVVVSGGSVVMVGAFGSVVLGPEDCPGFGPTGSCPSWLPGAGLDVVAEPWLSPDKRAGSVVTDPGTVVSRVASGAVAARARWERSEASRPFSCCVSSATWRSSCTAAAEVADFVALAGEDAAPAAVTTPVATPPAAATAMIHFFTELDLVVIAFPPLAVRLLSTVLESSLTTLPKSMMRQS